MSFHQPAFLFLFLPFCILILALPHGPRVRLAAITVLSFLYYALADPASLFLLAAVCVGNALFIEGIRRVSKTPLQRILVGMAIALNLLPLLWIKYSDASSVTSQYGHVAVNELTLPLGISFFTFQIVLLYVSGDYQKKSVNGLRMIPFIVFFPQLVLGPIQKFGELVPQLMRPRVSRQWQALGLLTIGLALMKKRVLSQSLLPFIERYDEVFSLQQAVTALDAWVYMLANTAYIYLDFSAYADMAVGVGLLLGIRLLDGFTSPFRAHSVGEFWRRWNVTLMRFFREAIYKPLARLFGDAVGARAVGVVLVMIACGIWHGPGLHFVVWGALVACFILIERFGMRLGLRVSFLPLQRLWVLLGFVLPLTVFLNPDMDRAFAILKPMLGLHTLNVVPANVYQLLDNLPLLGSLFVSADMESSLGVMEFVWLLLIWLMIMCCPSVPECRQRLGAFIESKSDTIQSAAWWVVVLASAVLVSFASLVRVGASGFFYFQF